MEFRHKYVTDLYGGRPAQTDKQCLNRFATNTPGFCRVSDDVQDLDVVLIGDSFGHNAYSGLASQYTYFGKNFAMVGWPGHQPLLKNPDESNYESLPAERMNKLIVNLANDRDIKTVILTMRQPEVTPIIKKQLIRTIKFFEENGKKVIFIYPPPVLIFEPIECIGFPPLRPKLNEECIQYVKDIDPQYFIGRIELQNVINNLTISSYDTYPQLCQENKCQIKIDDLLVYRQKGYFTVEGSKRAFQNFKE